MEKNVDEGHKNIIEIAKAQKSNRKKLCCICFMIIFIVIIILIVIFAMLKDNISEKK